MERRKKRGLIKSDQFGYLLQGSSLWKCFILLGGFIKRIYIPRPFFLQNMSMRLP